MKATTPSLTALLATLTAGCLITLAPAPAIAKSPETYTGAFSQTAVGGYDPVAYFEAKRPERGLPALSHRWKGAEYRFASPERLAKFRADPEAYAPQFGGYCAWAVSQGYLAKGDPRFWRVVGGKLYLNYDATVQKRWEADIPGLIAKARANWPRVLN
jgi:hypothetical protein